MFQGRFPQSEVIRAILCGGQSMSQGRFPQSEVVRATLCGGRSMFRSDLVEDADAVVLLHALGVELLREAPGQPAVEGLQHPQSEVMRAISHNPR